MFLTFTKKKQRGKPNKRLFGWGWAVPGFKIQLLYAVGHEKDRFQILALAGGADCSAVPGAAGCKSKNRLFLAASIVVCLSD